MNNLTIEKIENYKRKNNLANVYYCKSIKSLYAKILSMNIINLEEKIKHIQQMEDYYEALPIEDKNNIFFKLQKYLV